MSLLPARASFFGVSRTTLGPLPDRYDTETGIRGHAVGLAGTIACMTNIRGLDPFPRLDYADIPASQRAALEDVRRAGNAVRYARKHGKNVAPFQYAFKVACERLERVFEAEEQAWMNPTLFEGESE